jgi:nucleotide-binding universal stress UspA family protein
MDNPRPDRRSGAWTGRQCSENPAVVERRRFTMSSVVVGVDGSKGSVEALRYAIDEARLLDAGVKVVNAWHIPAIVYEAGAWGPVSMDGSALAKKAQDVLDRSLEEAGATESGVDVTTVVREGQPAKAICEEAKGADLLVVGSRGYGGFRGLLLGSVSQQCAHFAPCPVLIVPNRTSEGVDDT